jgi:hypothetical protein
MKGVRGVFAATLVLESIVVALALLVLPKFGSGATPAGIAAIGGVALALLLASGVQRRSWGLGVALGLQVAVLLCGCSYPRWSSSGRVRGWSGAGCCSCAATSPSCAYGSARRAAGAAVGA